MRDPRPAGASLAGLACGTIALVLAAVHLAAGPFRETPPMEEVIAEKAQSLYDRALEMFNDEPAPAAVRRPEPTEPDPDQILNGATAGLGALGIALGVIGFARRESLRACAGAVVLGVAALPWEIGLAVVVAILLVSLAGIGLPRTG